MDFPVNLIAEKRAIRLVPTARLRDPVLRKLVQDAAVLADLAEIESATSGRLVAQDRGVGDIDRREFVAGVPHEHFINAAFSYWRPGEMNRFNGPSRGAWYAALELETSLAEVGYHMTRELERVGNFNAVVDYSEMYASFAGEFVDLRGLTPVPACLHPDPAIGYPQGNLLADEARTRGYNGVVYPSCRRAEGTCLVALRPQAVQSVAQGQVLRLAWAGSREFKITQAG